MNEDNGNDVVLLNSFIDKFQREVSFIDGVRDNQLEIDDTFQKAYNCLLEFVEEKNEGLDFVITPLSTSLLCSFSKGIMIPDVPIGIVVTSCKKYNKEFGEKHQKLLKSILCYIGIVNVLEDVSLSGIIKTCAKEKPQRLYGYIMYDSKKNTTELCGLDEKLIDYKEWNGEAFSEILQEIEYLYNKTEEFIPFQMQISNEFFYRITPRQYETIKMHIAKNSKMIVQEKNNVVKETMAFASHLTMCKNTGLCTSYYFFNPPFIKNSSGSYLNYGNIVITVNNKLTPVWEMILNFFSLQLLSAYRIYFQKKIETELLRSYQKSAKAAIMSRNLSHNLGSHVMSYLKQNLASVEEMVKSGALMNVHEKNEILGKEMPFLVGMGKFISYLQERQDYIATVSTDYIPYPSIVNFKDGIYDELNPDYRFFRHKDKRSGYKPANLLLENIAKSEGLSRKTMYSDEIQNDNNIFIYFREFDGLKAETENEKKAYDSLRDWNFSLPGGIMGRQAVFSIVENVIRNAAKHGRRDKGDSLSVIFDIFDPTNDKDAKRWGDKAEFYDDYFNSSSRDYGDLYVVTLTAGTEVNEAIIKKIRNAINDSFVDDQGNLKQSNKGIKEMLISAAWLRSIRIEDRGQFELDQVSPILQVRQFENKLQYVFCLPKVKEVALVSNSFSVSSEVEDVMRRCGWRHFTYKDYLDSRTKKDYNIVIIDDINEKEAVRRCSHNNFFVVASHTNLKEHLVNTGLFSKFAPGAPVPDLAAEKMKLFKELFGNDALSIAICDIENFEQYNQYNNESVVAIKNEAQSEIERYQFFYRKHNDNEAQYSQFINLYSLNGFKNNLVFVEGISGGNSTDRLVRHGVIDDLWVSKHLHAMRTRVAIFDERLFIKLVGYDPSVDSPNLSNYNWSTFFEGLDIDNAKTMIFNHDRDHDKIIDGDVFYKWLDCNSIEEITSFANEYYPLSKFEKVDSVMPLVLHKKGIDLFTLVLTAANNDFFEIWGFDSNSLSTDGQKITQYGEVKKVGVLKLWENNIWCPQIKMEGDVTENYQYLTIHQGLLDKVYEETRIKQGEEISSENKRAVTKAFYDTFVDPNNKDCDWLQGLIIHSGRSKPNSKDMPQNQPFVQYSALENAVYDCKYTLVELLDYACFESEEQ